MAIVRHFCPFLIQNGLKLGQINAKIFFHVQNRISRGILDTIHPFYNFETDYMPKMPIFRHFGPFLTNVWLKTRSNQGQNIFSCPKSNYFQNFMHWTHLIRCNGQKLVRKTTFSVDDFYKCQHWCQIGVGRHFKCGRGAQVVFYTIVPFDSVEVVRHTT